jgi:hypothetical protein
VQQRQQGYLSLLLGQGANGGVETGEPPTVVVDPLNRVACFDQPVDEFVE